MSGFKLSIDHWPPTHLTSLLEFSLLLPHGVGLRSQSRKCSHCGTCIKASTAFASSSDQALLLRHFPRLTVSRRNSDTGPPIMADPDRVSSPQATFINVARTNFMRSAVE